MASETEWDETVPANTDQISSGDDAIRDFKTQIEYRMEKEHDAFSNSGGGGVHKEGSAMVYYAAAGDSLVRPDGSTALDSDDEGRIRFNSDDQLIRVYSGSAWVTANYISSVISISSGDALDITNSGTGNCIDLHPASTGIGIRTVSTAIGATCGSFTTFSSATVPAVIVTSGNSATASGEALCVVSGNSSAGAVIKAESGNSSTGNCLDLITGTSSEVAHINMSGDPTNASSTDGDIWFNGTNLKLNVATAVNHIAMSDAGTGGSASAGAGKQYIEINVAGTIYKVLHDGTV